MRDYEEFPEASDLNSLFYVGNPQNLSEETLKKLHDISQNKFFSLERLIKGKEKVWVIFGSRDLVQKLPELGLVEIEDYLSDSAGLQPVSDKTVSVDHVLSWTVVPKTNPQKQLRVTDQLSEVIVEPDQRLFFQAVLMPVKLGLFQTTLRVMVFDEDPISRVELAKRTERAFVAATGLNKQEDQFAESKKFDSFKQRSLIPKEVAVFNLSAGELLDLLRIS